MLIPGIGDFKAFHSYLDRDSDVGEISLPEIRLLAIPGEHPHAALFIRRKEMKMDEEQAPP